MDSGGFTAGDDGSGDVSMLQSFCGLVELFAVLLGLALLSGLVVLDEEDCLLALLLDVANEANGRIKLSAVRASFAGSVKNVRPEQVMIMLSSTAAHGRALGDMLLLR